MQHNMRNVTHVNLVGCLGLLDQRAVGLHTAFSVRFTECVGHECCLVQTGKSDELDLQSVNVAGSRTV